MNVDQRHRKYVKRDYESTSIRTRLALMATGSSPLLSKLSSSRGRPAAPVLGVLNLDAICIEASGMPGLGALATMPPYKSRVEAEEEVGGGVEVAKEPPVGVGGILDAAV